MWLQKRVMSGEQSLLIKGINSEFFIERFYKNDFGSSLLLKASLTPQHQSYCLKLEITS